MIHPGHHDTVLQYSDTYHTSQVLGNQVAFYLIAKVILSVLRDEVKAAVGTLKLHAELQYQVVRLLYN